MHSIIYSIIKINKDLNNNNLTEFNNINLIYRDIEDKLSLDYFLGRLSRTLYQQKLFEEIKRISYIEE